MSRTTWQYPEKKLDRITGVIELILVIGGSITGIALLLLVF